MSSTASTSSSTMSAARSSCGFGACGMTTSPRCSTHRFPTRPSSPRADRRAPTPRAPGAERVDHGTRIAEQRDVSKDLHPVLGADAHEELAVAAELTCAEGGLTVEVGDVREHFAPLARQQRSEEHTSEFQSRENLVCRLLLDKKKTQTLRRSFVLTKRITITAPYIVSRE